MPSDDIDYENDLDEHVDWSRLGTRPRHEVNDTAAEAKRSHGLTGRYTRFRAHIGDKTYDISVPDVKALRERLGLTQADFASRFHLSKRTVQQWEQGRAMPDTPARILLKAIERAPDVIAEAAAEVEREATIERGFSF
jgi:putative transcriptional regulator